MTVSDQGVAYAAFVEAELAAEYDRRSALDTRAASVATASTAFIALLTAITVLVTGNAYTFSASGGRGLLVSLGSLVVAALLALVAAQGRDYRVADAATLHAITAHHWTDSEPTARNVTTKLRSDSVVSLRHGSNRKAGILVVAFAFQMAALVGLVTTVAWEFRHHLGA